MHLTGNKKLDTLIITALTVNTKIGVHAWEQRIDQKLVIDLTLTTDFRDCQDELSKTIDYATLCDTVTRFVESKSFQLIETVANEVANLIQQEFKVTNLTVSVSKPHAVKNAGNIQVVVQR